MKFIVSFLLFAVAVCNSLPVLYGYGYAQNPQIITAYDYYYLQKLQNSHWEPPVVTVPTTVQVAAVPLPQAPSLPVALSPIANPRPSPVRVSSAITAAAQPTSKSYAFNYDIESPDGRQSRTETSDESGNVSGSYGFSLSDGRQRTVTYTAGTGGFKATVDTNEQGTETKNSADVVYSNSAPQAPAALRKPGQVAQAASPVVASATHSWSPAPPSPSVPVW